MNTVLFDLDGTLTDPKEGIINCITYALNKLELEYDSSVDLSKYIGPPLHKTFEDIFESYDESLINSAIAYYRERFKTKGMFENYVYEGVEDLLAYLSDADCRLYVATSKPTIFAKQILDHFNLSRYFKCIYGSELDGSLADKSDLIRHIISREKMANGKCFMVGDRKQDAIGAINNGLAPIGILWGYGSQEELASAGVIHIFSTPAELKWLADK